MITRIVDLWKRIGNTLYPRVANDNLDLGSGDFITTGDVDAGTHSSLTLTPLATGFSVAGGTAPKTLTVSNDADVSGTNTGDQDLEPYKTYCGFVNRTDSEITINSGTGVLTLAVKAPATSFDVYVNDVKKTISTTQTVTITEDQQITYVYIDSNGVLQKSLSVWDITSCASTPCAIVFKDGANYAVTDERHGHERNKAWHNWAHMNIGTMYKSGLTGTFTNTTLSIAQGVIYDEDLRFDTGGTETTATLWYRNGASGMRMVRGSTTPYTANAGVLQYDDGTGTLANVDNNSYSTQWVYATNDETEPIYVVVGQNNTNSLATARNATAPVINLSTAEWKLIYRVIYRRVGATPTFVEAADFRTVQTGVVSSAISTDHAALINRDAANSHPASAINFTNENIDLGTGTLSSGGVKSGAVTIDDTDSPYTVLASDYTLICDTEDGDITVNLPACDGGGRILNIKKIHENNTVTITPDGTDTIDGESTWDVTIKYENIQIQDVGFWAIL